MNFQRQISPHRIMLDPPNFTYFAMLCLTDLSKTVVLYPTPAGGSLLSSTCAREYKKNFSKRAWVIEQNSIFKIFCITCNRKMNFQGLISLKRRIKLVDLTFRGGSPLKFDMRYQNIKNLSKFLWIIEKIQFSQNYCITGN